MVGYSKQLVRWRSGAGRYAQGLYGNLCLGSAGVRNKNEIKKRPKNRLGDRTFFSSYSRIIITFRPVLYCWCFFFFCSQWNRDRTDKIRRCGYHHLLGLDNILMSVPDNDHPIQKYKIVDHIWSQSPTRRNGSVIGFIFP